MTDLHAEVNRGKRAQQAYDYYMKELINELHLFLFNEFIHSDPNNHNAIIELKRLVASVTTIEQRIQQDIETGKLAERQLDEQDKGIMQ